jgi:thiol-disulfide isomerase/thioredoxin
MRLARIASATLLVLSSVLAASPRPAAAAGRDLTGQTAPEIFVTSGLRGLPAGATLASFRGRVVVLKFFFTTCPACKASLPEFERLYRTYGSRAQFIALAYDDHGSVARLLDVGGYSFPTGVDPRGISAGRYGVRTYPTNYLIGADGVVRAYENLSSPALEAALAAAAASPPSAPPPTSVATTFVVVERERNVTELGTVPAVLVAVKAHAYANDYGAVMRVVEAHLDAAKETADVVAAARRIHEIAKRRYENRVRRARERWDAGDRAGAWADVKAIVRDFKGTSVERVLQTWAGWFEERMTAAPAAR